MMAMIWIGAGLLLALSELIVPGFVIIFFGFGAILTGLLTLCFNMPEWLQCLLFTISSVASLLILRRYLPNIFGGKEEKVEELPAESLECEGQIARVVDKIEPGLVGSIMFQGSVWKATSEDNLPAGEDVVIVKRSNITFVVKKR